MGGQYKENWKRLTGQYTPNGPNASDPQDILRVQDGHLLSSSASGLPFLNVNNVFSASPYYAQPDDDLIVIRTSGTFDVILPLNPPSGKLYEIKDGAGDGCLVGVDKTIVPSGSNTIEFLFSTFPLTNCYQSWSVVWAGDTWRLI